MGVLDDALNGTLVGIDAEMKDTLETLTKWIDGLLTECSGREIVSSMQVSDKLLDMRQLVVLSLWKLASKGEKEST